MTDIDILKLVCRKLEHSNIPYMLTGSLAANLYALPRMTRDLDFVIEILKPEVEKFFQLFEDDFYLDKGSILDAIKYESMFNIIHKTSIYKADFIIRKNEIYRGTEFQRRQQIELAGEPIWIVSLEDLIISKLFWAKDSFSEMQIKDIRNLIKNAKIKIDFSYVQNWIQELGLHEIYKKVVSS